jgi:hypothetical protein
MVPINMAFVRIKTRKNQKGEISYYGYLVKNFWDKKKNSSRQKVSKYLGRVIILEKVSDINFFDFLNLKDTKDKEDYLINSNKNQIIRDLVLWELYKHNAQELGIKYNSQYKSITQENKSIVVEVNNGYMCGYMIRRLFNFDDEFEGDDRKVGIELAKRLRLTGILVPEEAYLELFEKIAKTIY